MRPLFRAAVLLSLAAAPLAVANPESASPTSTSSDSTVMVKQDSKSTAEAAVLQTRVNDLEATVKGLRSELAKVQEQEDARVRVIGDPNDHPLWP